MLSSTVPARLVKTYLIIQVIRLATYLRLCTHTHTDTHMFSAFPPPPTPPILPFRHTYIHGKGKTRDEALTDTVHSICANLVQQVQLGGGGGCNRTNQCAQGHVHLWHRQKTHLGRLQYC